MEEQEPKKVTFFFPLDHTGGVHHEYTRRVVRVDRVLAGNPAIKTLQPERREKQFITAR